MGLAQYSIKFGARHDHEVLDAQVTSFHIFVPSEHMRRKSVEDLFATLDVHLELQGDITSAE